MPFETFYNLPLEKQNRIIEAAIAEFAGKGYKRASIESIAKGAGVAKGSMYQYFENKKELYFYLIDIAIQMRTNFMSGQINQRQDGSFFNLLENMLISGVEYARKYPDYYHIYHDISMATTEEIQNEIKGKVNCTGGSCYITYIKEAAETGELRKDLSVELAAFVVFTIINEFNQYLVDKMTTVPGDEYKQYVRQFVEILKNGIKNKEVLS